MNPTANHFLDCYAKGIEVEGGLMFGKALQQARLDGSAGSLERIEALLGQIREKARPVREEFESSPAGINFCYMLAFHLGRHVAETSGAQLDWHEYRQATQVLPADYGLPEAFFSRIFGVAGGVVFLPLGWIGDKLFGPERSQTCAEYVSAFVEKITARVGMTDDAWSQDYLARFFADRSIPGGLAFRSQLKRARLDHSMESLGRIDALLAEVRATRPDYGDFVNRQETGNFLLLLAYYIGSTIARAGRFSIKWLGFDEVRASLPEIERNFETTTGCLLAGRFYFPLGVLSESLFAANPERTVSGYGAGILASNKPDFTPITRPNASGGAGADGVATNWSAAVHATGVVAAYGMFMIADGATLIPTLLVPGADGKRTFVKLMSDTLEEAQRRGEEALAGNPERSSWLVFVFEAYARLPSGRTDALIVEMRCYDAPPLTLKACFPFRPASDPQGFAILEPQLIECSAAGVFEQLTGTLYEGIDSFKTDSFSWSRYRQADATEAAPESAGADPKPASGEAVIALRKAAEAGSADAQYRLAMCLENGEGVEQDYAQCVHWYAQAAAQGHGAAINNLADKYEHGRGVAQDLPKALALYLQAADKNILAAWYSLGQMYRDGRGVTPDLHAAIKWMEQAAHFDFLDAKDLLKGMQREAALQTMEEGAAVLANAADADTETLYETATRVYDPEVPETMPLAFELYLHAAKRGHSESQHQVAFRYQRGLGITANAALALDWYRQSAALGNVNSIERLGELYEDGEMVPQDLRKAFEYSLQAANQGAIFARYRLACMYQEGRGTAVDERQAIRWMKESADLQLGDSVARLESLRNGVLEKWLAKGEELLANAASTHALVLFRFAETLTRPDVPQAVATAFCLYLCAAEKNHKEAQAIVAACYEAGKGVAQDDEAARRWWKRAADQGHPVALTKVKKPFWKVW